MRWQQALRQAVSRLPNIRFTVSRTTDKAEESIQLVEQGGQEPSAELQPQQEPPARSSN
jgi:hypothetical protein